MQVTINTENRSGRVRNFWKHIHFHPTDAGELQLHSPEEMIFPDGFSARDLVMPHNAGGCFYSLSCREIHFVLVICFIQQYIICAIACKPCLLEGYATSEAHL